MIARWQQSSTPSRWISCTWLGILALAGSCVGGSADVLADDLQAFLKTHCLACHDRDESAGEREFESLDFTATDIDTQRAVQEIIDQLTLGAMPPDDQPQPSDDERLAIIGQLNETLRAMRRQGQSESQPQTVLRRLSQREYLHTLRDLLDLELAMFDPTADFPSDHLEPQFDTFGESLVTSGFLLERYLQVADECIEKAFAVDAPPEVRQWHFTDRFFPQPELSRPHKQAFNNRFLCLYDHPLCEKPEGAYGFISEFRSGVPVDGVYEIRVLAQAMHRDSPYSQRSVRLPRDEPFRLGIRPGDTRLRDMYHVQPLQKLLAETTVADDQPTWYTFRIPLDRGFAPRFTFENGIHDSRSSYNLLYRFDRDQLPESIRRKQGIFDRRIAVIAQGQMPHIRIHEVHLRGPLDFAWPTPARQRWLGGAVFDPARAEKVIGDFASGAFRRPVAAPEQQRWVQLYRDRIDGGREPFEALKDTFKAVLCSPSFLYFKTPADPEAQMLTDHGLAERLAYFLTASPPDDQLLAAADAGTIGQPEVLIAQTRRLLAKSVADRRVVDEFLAGFLDNWLNLQALGSMPPDPGPFWEYYARGLEPEMKTETRLFVRDLLDRNASLLELIDSQSSFVNRDLARLYNIVDQVPPDDAARFRRVSFNNRQRGGLLGQAAVLTVTANGIDTSPITRGVWILERILGTPTPPPPDDVPELDPDIRGATTIRDQLQRHRADAACYQCHRKIDPLGFAMESFDPIGRFRSQYPNRAAIDSSGTLPGGETFAGVAELKQQLVERRTLFAKTFTENLLAHAIGRPTGPADRGAVEEILAQVENDDYPFAHLIEAVVTSEAFRRR